MTPQDDRFRTSTINLGLGVKYIINSCWHGTPSIVLKSMTVPDIAHWSNRCGLVISFNLFLSLSFHYNVMSLLCKWYIFTCIWICSILLQYFDPGFIDEILIIFFTFVVMYELNFGVFAFVDRAFLLVDCVCASFVLWSFCRTIRCLYMPQFWCPSMHQLVFYCKSKRNLMN